MSHLAAASCRPIYAVVALLVLGATPALALERLEVKGDPPKTWIEGDKLGFFYEIPKAGELHLDVKGPGILVMFLVNHQTDRVRGSTSLVVSKDKKAWKRLKLGCGSTRKTFVRGGKVRPCKRITRDLRVPAGSHRIGLRLARTKVGASVHFLFASQAEIDREPELVASMVPPTPEAGWREISDPPEVSDEEPALTSVPAAPGFGEAIKEPLPWIVAGAAVAALGGAAYFGVDSRTKFDDAARNNVTQRERQSLNQQGKDSAIIANGLFGVAGAGLVGAAIILLIDARTPVARVVPSDTVGAGQSAWGITPHLGDDTCGVDAWLRF